ncbi:MAG TPA: DUF58 domain-containing protein [Desulfobacteraceae bacterium]|nr:DUF58 domain-containing protein [Desulfobacteraceae bacterium]
MLSKELIKTIQRFHFKTRYLANEMFAGQYTSAFKGRGMEFAEVREYIPGDDIRIIDWNVSARFGRPFVKMFHEERELTVILVIDLSASNMFATRTRFKRDLIAEVAGTLAFLAIKTNDKVGAILFTSSVEKFIPPKKGSAHVWRLIKEIFTHEESATGTNIEAALTYLNRTVKRNSIVFLLSDFMDAGYEKALKITSSKHDLTMIRVEDDAEKSLPDMGRVTFTDPESGEICHVNTSNRRVRRLWKEEREKKERDIKSICSRCGASLIELNTKKSAIKPLMRYFFEKGRR